MIVMSRIWLKGYETIYFVKNSATFQLLDLVMVSHHIYQGTSVLDPRCETRDVSVGSMWWLKDMALSEDKVPNSAG